MKWFKVSVAYTYCGCETSRWDTFQARDWHEAIGIMAEKMQMLKQSFTHAEAHEVPAPEDER